MTSSKIFNSILALVIFFQFSTIASYSKSNELEYPTAKTIQQKDNYHGVEVSDPYRWLEDPHSEATKKWIEEENKVTFSFLENIKVRSLIDRRLNDLWSYPKHGIPFKEGGKLFYYKNTGTQDMDVLYVKFPDESSDRVLIDPNELSKKEPVNLSGISVSEDGKYLAYALSRSGSDWQEWNVKEIDTDKVLEDKLLWSKFSGASWAKDGGGFYYSRYDKPDEKGKFKSKNYYQKLYFHKVGTSQKDDKLIYERKDQKEWGFDGYVTEDGHYLVIHVWKGTENKNRIFYKDLAKQDSKVVELLNEADAHYGFIENDDDTFYFRTNLNAPRSKVISLKLSTFNSKKPKFETVIPEQKATLVAANMVGGKLILRYLKDAFSKVSIYSTAGSKIKDVELPGIGTAYGFGGRKDQNETYYGYTSFNTPMVLHKYNIDTGNDTVIFKPNINANTDLFETKQVFVKSKDGTKIPLFITHRKGLKLDGNNPTYLYGYGGFNISKVPNFSIPMFTWMEMGGVFAQGCLRGGGEYGEAWHKAGMKLNKQNVFDDFIACGEWLIDNKYTKKERLAIAGGSNGGLLVGACLTQRPDLFGAACPSVGVMDMLRFHKFTIGWGWTSDYGCADNKDEFKALYAYSPLHNIKKGVSYPPTFITTADHDDRVVPAHSFKFTATLQNAQKGSNPILIRIETKAGHGKGKPTSKRIEEARDKFAFLTRVLDFEEEAEKNLSQAFSNNRRY